MQKSIFLVPLAAILLLLASCKKKVDDFTVPPLTDYYPLQVGKYITYQLDSTVFLAFGVRDTIITYQVQDRVDAQITDAKGRPAYRIFRFIRKNESQQWLPNNTFMVVAVENSIEFVENNLRFIKLVLPVTAGRTWKGNSYLTSDPYPSFGFSSSFTDDWDYTYDSINMPLTLNSLTIDSTIKVVQSDVPAEQDPGDPATQYAERTYAIEKYGKGIGLVYKEFLHWEYQGVTSSFTGFGIKLTIIDHN